MCSVVELALTGLQLHLWATIFQKDGSLLPFTFVKVASKRTHLKRAQTKEACDCAL